MLPGLFLDTRPVTALQVHACLPAETAASAHAATDTLSTSCPCILLILSLVSFA